MADQETPEATSEADTATTDASEKTESQYAIGGMTCNHCVQAVESALGEIPGVDTIKADLEKGIATLSHDGSVAEEKVKEIVEEIGFTFSK